MNEIFRSLTIGVALPSTSGCGSTPPTFADRVLAVADGVLLPHRVHDRLSS